MFRYQRLSKEQRRVKILSYLTKHPDSTFRDLSEDGLAYDLRVVYNKRICDAKMDAGIHGNAVTLEQRRHKVLAYLQEHPTATFSDFREAGLSYDLLLAYEGKINTARKAAGLLDDGSISAADAARILGVSRERVSQLFENGKLSGHRLGRKVFVTSSSIKKWKQKKSSRENIRTA